GDARQAVGDDRDRPGVVRVHVRGQLHGALDRGPEPAGVRPMTTTDAPPESRSSLPLTAPRLPSWAPALVGVVAFGAAGLLALLAGWGITALAVLTAAIFIVALPLWAASVEGRRGAVDRLMTALVWTSFAVAVAPLVWVLWTVVDNGLEAINSQFLTYDMRNVVGDEQGGIYHAII